MSVFATNTPSAVTAPASVALPAVVQVSIYHHYLLQLWLHGLLMLVQVSIHLHYPLLLVQCEQRSIISDLYWTAPASVDYRRPPVLLLSSTATAPASVAVHATAVKVATPAFSAARTMCTNPQCGFCSSICYSACCRNKGRGSSCLCNWNSAVSRSIVMQLFQHLFQH